MASSDGRFRITFNGEIYNYRTLRSQLQAEGVEFRTQSDTEVLIESWRRRGAHCLTRLSGQFAFALWDENERTLSCVRDRVGEKPFHYMVDRGALVFASELKAVAAWPCFSRSIDANAVADFLTFGFILDPRTIWQGVHKLPAAHWMQVHLPLTGPPEVGTPQRYWDLAFTPDESVRDWSAVTAARSRAGHDVRAFTVGFDDAGFDERPYARQVAERYHTAHRERVVAPDDMESMREAVLAQYDEPFGDYSALPTYALCREERGEITVALSGDGGDEVFAGYTRYQRVALHARAESLMTAPLMRLGARAGAQLVRDLGLRRPALRARSRGTRRRARALRSRGLDRRAHAPRAARRGRACEYDALSRPAHDARGRHPHEGRSRIAGGRARGAPRLPRPVAHAMGLMPSAAQAVR